MSGLGAEPCPTGRDGTGMALGKHRAGARTPTPPRRSRRIGRVPQLSKLRNTARQTVDTGLGRAKNNSTEIPITTRGT